VNAPQPIAHTGAPTDRSSSVGWQAAIQQYARQLYLTTVAEQFARLAEEAVTRKQSHLGYLEALLEAEIEERERRNPSHQGGAFPGGQDA